MGCVTSTERTRPASEKYLNRWENLPREHHRCKCIPRIEATVPGTCALNVELCQKPCSAQSIAPSSFHAPWRLSRPFFPKRDSSQAMPIPAWLYVPRVFPDGAATSPNISG